MEIAMDVSLDPTLGCGQAHRWRKTADGWQGVLDNSVVTLTQTPRGFRCEGAVSKRKILEYFRHGDDLAAIYENISASDGYLASVAEACPGLRLLRQDPWECTATYILAVNANVKRIISMVESVCDEFGRDLGALRAFPTPGEILDGADRIAVCKLGYREKRFVDFAGAVEDGDVDLGAIGEMDYAGCREALKEIHGIGDKVADCISLFAFGHMESFPVDARIKAILRDVYGVEGTYAELADFGRRSFGDYPGYAQELLYHAKAVSLVQAQSGGSRPVSTL